jgi:hypothetical protein
MPGDVLDTNVVRDETGRGDEVAVGEGVPSGGKNRKSRETTEGEEVGVYGAAV